MRPSPLAARMLRAMVNYDIEIKYYKGSWTSYIDWEIPKERLPDYKMINDSLVTVKIAQRNVDAAIKQGWIECHRLEEHENYKYEYYRINDVGRSTIKDFDSADFYPKKPEISHRDLQKFMIAWYESHHTSFVYLPELSYGGSIIDGYSVSLWYSQSFRAVAYEMKASRADFLNEIRNPEKREDALAISHQYFFVTPRKLVAVKEIPDSCGLIEIDKRGHIHTVLDAPFRKVSVPNWDFVALVLRRARRVYEKLLDSSGRDIVRYF